MAAVAPFVTELDEAGPERQGRGGDRRDRPRHGWRKPVLRLLVALLATLLAGWFVLTSATPWVDERPAPSAEEVSAGRDAVRQLRMARAGLGSQPVRLGQAQLDGVSALASHGFRPDRLQVRLEEGVISATGSHRLPGGRWLNVKLTSRGRSEGFPESRLTVGLVSLPAWATRWAMEAGRQLLRLRGVDLPPLDRMVRRVNIRREQVSAYLSLPAKTGMIDGLMEGEAERIDAAEVTGAYCALARAQTAAPVGDLAGQVRRAFILSDPAEATPARNRAKFVALAMLLVDERAGELAGGARADTTRCRIASPAVTLHGRDDLTKHWALSAALAARTGAQFAQAMGEWKELADSLGSGARFAAANPTGFSFVDLAADRSGYRTAQAAASPDAAAEVATALSNVTAEQLLPTSLLAAREGMRNDEFTREFGSIEDQRFAAVLARIDADLDRGGLPPAETR